MEALRATRSAAVTNTRLRRSLCPPTGTDGDRRHRYATERRKWPQHLQKGEDAANETTCVASKKKKKKASWTLRERLYRSLFSHTREVFVTVFFLLGGSLIFRLQTWTRTTKVGFNSMQFRPIKCSCSSTNSEETCVTH